MVKVNTIIIIMIEDLLGPFLQLDVHEVVLICTMNQYVGKTSVFLVVRVLNCTVIN